MTSRPVHVTSTARDGRFAIRPCKREARDAFADRILRATSRTQQHPFHDRVQARPLDSEFMVTPGTGQTF